MCLHDGVSYIFEVENIIISNRKCLNKKIPYILEFKRLEERFYKILRYVRCVAVERTEHMTGLDFTLYVQLAFSPRSES